MIFIIRFSALQISSKLVYFLLWLFLIFYFFFAQDRCVTETKTSRLVVFGLRLGLNNNGSFGFV